jgi:small-conductance mechanosensitive channel
VQQILLEAAEQEAMVVDYRQPAVRFTEYADSSINFVLLFWIDVRKTARRRVKSALYFNIFDQFKKAGIEIPFPQRDINLRGDHLAAPSFANDEQAQYAKEVHAKPHGDRAKLTA